MKNNIMVLLFKLLGTGCIACGSLFGYVDESSHIYEKPEVHVENKIEEKSTVEESVVEEITLVQEAEPEEIHESTPIEVAPIVEVVPPQVTNNKISIPNIYENNLMKDPSGQHYYLNRNINGVYDGIGVPYIDFRNDFTGRKTIIYAHSSVYGNGPFQILQNYHNNPSFYYQNPYITITYEGKTYTYQIFSVYVSLADSEQSEGLEYYHVMNYSDEDWENTILKYKNNSEYDTGVTVNKNDKILILQTCSMDPNYYEKYYRYNLVIMAKLIN